jgi:hypothetical protein
MKHPPPSHKHPAADDELRAAGTFNSSSQTPLLIEGGIGLFVKSVC